MFENNLQNNKLFNFFTDIKGVVIRRSNRSASMLKIDKFDKKYTKPIPP